MFSEGANRKLRAAVTVSPENVRWKHGMRLVRMQVDGLLFQFVVGSDEVVSRHRVIDLFLQQGGRMVVGIEDLTTSGFCETLGDVRSASFSHGEVIGREVADL